MESRNIFDEFIAKLEEGKENNIVSEYSPSMVFQLLIAMWVVFGVALLSLECFFLKTPEYSADHNPANDEDDDEPAQPTEPEAEYSDDHNERLLGNVGMTETDMSEHPKIGFFYDFVKHSIPDNPVVLNTGDIVDEETAKKLIQNKSRLPRGGVTGFFSSFHLRSLLDVLIKEEVEKRTQEKNNQSFQQNLIP